jgi:hypothetical protein
MRFRREIDRIGKARKSFPLDRPHGATHLRNDRLFIVESLVKVTFCLRWEYRRDGEWRSPSGNGLVGSRFSATAPPERNGPWLP